MIVKAVNCHDDLLAAARGYANLILSDYEGLDGHVGGAMQRTYDDQLALIGKAEGAP